MFFFSRNRTTLVGRVYQIQYSKYNNISAYIDCALPGAFECDDGGGCVPSMAKCNGRNECADWSDELHCHNKSSVMAPRHLNSCVDGQFQCRQTFMCIPNTWLCDGDYDCGGRDTSDEDSCHQMKKCPPNQSECDHDVCLDTSRFCDGVYDCANDEGAACRKISL